MKARQILYAEDGMVLTNGTEYGRVIYLGDGVSAEAYYEITEEEHDRIMREKAEVLA